MRRTSSSSQFSREVLNRIQIKLPALSVNEGMARAAVAAFISQLDPGVTEIADVKCAVSEAVMVKYSLFQVFLHSFLV